MPGGDAAGAGGASAGAGRAACTASASGAGFAAVAEGCGVLTGGPAGGCDASVGRRAGWALFAPLGEGCGVLGGPAAGAAALASVNTLPLAVPAAISARPVSACNDSRLGGEGTKATDLRASATAIAAIVAGRSLLEGSILAIGKCPNHLFDPLAARLRVTC